MTRIFSGATNAHCGNSINIGATGNNTERIGGGQDNYDFINTDNLAIAGAAGPAARRCA